MKKNMILLTALSLFLHMPLFSIPIGACFLEKDGKRIDIWGDIHMPPAQAESENAKTVKKQHTDVIDYVKHKQAELLVEGMTPTDEQMRKSQPGGDGLVFLGDLPKIAENNGVEAKNIEWRDASAYVCWCAERSYPFPNATLMAAISEMNTHATKDADLKKLSDIKDRYFGQESCVLSPEDAEFFLTRFQDLFEESILGRINKQTPGSHAVICVGLLHLVNLRKKLIEQGYAELGEPAGEVPDDISKEDAEKIWKAFDSGELLPLNIGAFLKQKDQEK